MTEPRPFITTSELGAALGVSADTIRNWADTGRIPKPERGCFSLRSHRRWSLPVAAEIVRSRGRHVPEWWGAPTGNGVAA